MQVKSIIDRIEKAGYKVRLTHYRFFGRKLLRNADIRVLVKAMKIMDSNNTLRNCGEMINTKGGLTIAEVKVSDRTFTTKAECSLS